MTRIAFDRGRLDELVSIVRAGALEDCVQRIRAEYLDLPGLSLTARQAQRLWSLDSETCQRVLDMMIRDNFLRRTPQAQYVRGDWCRPVELHPTAAMTLLGHAAQLEMTVGETGRLETIKTSRWGNPEGGEFRSVDFGAVAEEEATFDGYTIPIRLRVGWHFVNGRFESDGEFFRGIIDDATFR